MGEALVAHDRRAPPLSRRPSCGTNGHAVPADHDLPTWARPGDGRVGRFSWAGIVSTAIADVLGPSVYPGRVVIIGTDPNGRGLWLYAVTGRRLIDEHVSDARIRSRTRRYLPGPLMYAITLPLAFISPWISLALYGIYALFWMIPPPD